jgi:hypothetical protein
MVIQLDSNQHGVLFYSLFWMFYTGVMSIVSGEKHREVGSPGRCAIFVMSQYITDHHQSKSTLDAHNWSTGSFSVNLIIEHTSQGDFYVNHIDIPPQFLLSPPLVCTPKCTS